MEKKKRIVIIPLIALMTVAISLSIALPILSTPIDDEITKSIQNSILKMKDFKWLNPDYNYVTRREKGEDGLWNRGDYGLGYFETKQSEEGILFKDIASYCYDPRPGSNDYLTSDTSNIDLNGSAGDKAYVLTQFFNIMYFHSFGFDKDTNENLNYILDFIKNNGFSYYKNTNITNVFIKKSISGYYKIEFYGKEYFRYYNQDGTVKYRCTDVLITGFVLHKGLHKSNHTYGKFAGEDSFKDKLDFIDDTFVDSYGCPG